MIEYMKDKSGDGLRTLELMKRLPFELACTSKLFVLSSSVFVFVSLFVFVFVFSFVFVHTCTHNNPGHGVTVLIRAPDCNPARGQFTHLACCRNLEGSKS